MTNLKSGLEVSIIDVPFDLEEYQLGVKKLKKKKNQSKRLRKKHYKKLVSKERWNSYLKFKKERRFINKNYSSLINFEIVKNFYLSDLTINV